MGGMAVNSAPKAGKAPAKAAAPPAGVGKQSFSSSVRQRVEQAQQRTEEEQRRKLLGQRVDIANMGIAAYKNRQMGEAVKHYYTYIRILEQSKRVQENQLHPGVFDTKTEMPELLMLSGIYWDLAKLFDRTKSKDKFKDFAKYLEKYILFSKGMPYQALCAEAIRKYLKMEKAIHKDAFKNAYKVMGGKTKCFVATSLIDVTVPDTLFELRRFRDQVLKKNHPGRMFVAWYYRKGPKIANRLDEAPHWLRRLCGVTLDFIGRVIRATLRT
jgi:hypothetical protein